MDRMKAVSINSVCVTEELNGRRGVLIRVPRCVREGCASDWMLLHTSLDYEIPTGMYMGRENRVE